MSITPHGSAVTVISDATYNAFTGFAEFPNGSLISFYRTGATHVSLDGVIDQKISTNGGATWGAAATIYDPGSGNDARELDAILLANGTFLASFWENISNVRNAYTMIGTITDSAVVWASPVALRPAIGEECAFKPLQLANGNILVPFRYTGANGLALSTTGVRLSTDNGASWVSEVEVMTDPTETYRYNECSIKQLPNGHVVMIARNEDLAGYSRSVSTDNGATWSAPANVIDITTAFPGRPNLEVLPSGDLALFCRGNGPGGGDLSRAVFTVSADEGVTWAAFTNYGSDLNFVYAAAQVLASGRIGAVIARENSSTDAFVVYQAFVELGAGFRPSMVFDLLCLEADVIAGADDDPVTTWPDVSGSGNDAGQATAGAKPTYKTNILNGKPVVRFDGTADFMSLASLITAAGDATMVIVFVPTGTITNATAAQRIIGRTVGTNPRCQIILGSASGALTGEVIAWLVIQASATVRGVAHDQNIVGANAFYFTLTGTTELIYKNGTSVANLTATDGGLDASIDAKVQNIDSIGASAGVGFFPGDIAFIGIADAVLGTTARNLLGGYLQDKYGITIADAEIIAERPTISPAGGSHVGEVEVTLACATPGVTMYYTTDGSTPDATDTEYTAPFTLEESATIKAIAIKAGFTDSAVAEAEFTVTQAAGRAVRIFNDEFFRNQN